MCRCTVFACGSGGPYRVWHVRVQFDLLAPSRAWGRSSVRRRCGAAVGVLSFFLATAVPPPLLVVHEHRGGEHAHTHVFAYGGESRFHSEDPPHSEHHHHERHRHDRFHHRHSRIAGDSHDDRNPVSKADIHHVLVLRTRGDLHRAHWHGTHPFSLCVPRLPCLFTAAPVSRACFDAGLERIPDCPADTPRARGPPAARPIPTSIRL